MRTSTTGRTNPKGYGKLMGHGPLPVRCALVGGDELERPTTDMPSDTLSRDDPEEACHLRRGVETCFQMPEDRLQTGNMTGTKPVPMERGACAAACLPDVAFDMDSEAEAKARATMLEGRHRHETAVNESPRVGIPRDEPMRLVLADDPGRSEMMSAIVTELGRHLVPIRRDRSYSREGLRCQRANRHGNTHRRVF